MTSSELPELLAVSDRIIVLCEGRITAEIPRAEATEEAIMHAATAFLDRTKPAARRPRLLNLEPRSSRPETAMRATRLPLVLVCLTCSPRMAAAADFPRFQTQEIDPHAGEVCYAVTVADVNGDQKPDVVAVTEDAVVWYENPSWRKHDIIRKATARDNVCIQPHDIDGDGRVDFALGAGWRPTDTKNPSTLQWLGRDAEGRWQVHPIRFDEPTLHRLRWGDVKGTGQEAAGRRPVAGPRDQGPELGGRAGGARPRL